jgi:hypothetical protein
MFTLGRGQIATPLPRDGRALCVLAMGPLVGMGRPEQQRFGERLRDELRGHGHAALARAGADIGVSPVWVGPSGVPSGIPGGRFGSEPVARLADTVTVTMPAGGCLLLFLRQPSSEMGIDPFAISEASGCCRSGSSRLST